jgi:hypothetical protein
MKNKLSLRDKFFGKKVNRLPPNFFEKILDCQLSLKCKFNEKTLQELVSYYVMAIEYYESIGDQRYIQYQKSMNLLFSESQVKNYLCGRGKRLEERKKDINNIINNELNTQKSNFQKRKEAKKKKYLLSISDITNTIESMKNKRYINNNMNKSFDFSIKKLEDNSNILSELKDNDLDKKDNKLTNKNKFLEQIKNCMDVYFNEYYEYFTNKIVSGVIKDYENNSKYHSKLLCDSAVGYATQEKEMEFLITPQSDDAFKEQILSVVSQLKEESKTEIEKYNKSNMVKLKKINEKYSQDIIKNPGIELIQEKFKLDITNLLSSRLFN